MSNVKTQIRQAAIAALDGISAKTIGTYSARVLETDQLPAVLVSVAISRTEEPLGTMELFPILASLSFRLVGLASLDPARTTNVVDDLEVVEQEIYDRLGWARGEDDPLGLGVADLYLDNTEEPTVDDEHEVPLAIIEVTYGVMLRVDRDTLSIIQ